MRSHEWIDRRSLALHNAVAAKLEADPALIDVAKRNVDRWLRVNRTAALVEWERLLTATPVAELVRVLRSMEQDAIRLRQSSPFAGLLSNAERQAIFREYDARRS